MEKKRLVSTGRVLFAILLSLTFLASAKGQASGQTNYPSKPIEIICTFSPGGQTDLAVRVLAEFLRNKLGQPVVVVSKPGASGMLGTSLLAKADPDGYTIASIGDAQTIAAFLLHKPPYKLSDLKLIAQWGNHHVVMAVPADSSWKSMNDFIQYAKKNPGVKCGTHNKGSSPWVRVQFLMKEAEIQLDGVPFKDDPGVLAAVLGKHVPIGVFGYVTAKAQQQAGKLRMLMTFTPGGIEGEQNLPTLKEVLGKEAVIYPPVMAVYVPAKTPEPIAHTLRNTIKAITSDQAFRTKLAELGVGVEYADGEEFQRRADYTYELMKKILVEAKMIPN